MLDVRIDGVLIVDGTGAEPVLGTVGIRDGRIASVDSGGAADGPAEDAGEVIDGRGLALSPGFIDPHTHYDAQLFWDPMASPSNLHGVTSMIAGNCGFTLAPLIEGDSDYIARMMAKVEGMPLPALEQGVPWEWSEFGEYLDRVETGGLGVNVGFMVGHCALRRRVMGTSAVGADATPEQLATMERLLAEAIGAGGLGLSTTLARTHSDGDGSPVASRWAERDELLALARVVADSPAVGLEYASDGCLDGFTDDDSDDWRSSVPFMIDFALAAGRPLNWNVLTVDAQNPARYQSQLAAMDRCREAGAEVVALTMPILVGMNMSFLNYCGLFMLPDWGQILTLPPVARLACLRDADVRRFLLERAASPEAGVFKRLTGWDTYVIGDTFADPSLAGRMVCDIAAERGISSFDALIEVIVADELRTVLWPGATDDDDLSWTYRAEAWQHPSVMIGGSDAGAHLDRMCGQPYTTQWIGDCVRGRQLTSLQDAVRHLTSVPAKLFGLHDRGVIAEGNVADLVLFDPATIDAGRIEQRHDLPGGTARLYADAIGIDRVLVGGVTTVRDGAPTGERPGRVLRSGRDAVHSPA